MIIATIIFSLSLFIHILQLSLSALHHFQFDTLIIIIYMYIDKQYIRRNCGDTAGQQRFKTVTASFYRGAMGVMLVCDITNEQSYFQFD